MCPPFCYLPSFILARRWWQQQQRWQGQWWRGSESYFWSAGQAIRQPDKVMWRELSRRGITFNVVVPTPSAVRPSPDTDAIVINSSINREVICTVVLIVYHRVVTPCRHVVMEKYFKDPTSTQSYVPCLSKCLYCTKGVGALIGRIHCQKLTNSLISFCSRGTSETPVALIKHLRWIRKSYYTQTMSPGEKWGKYMNCACSLCACGIFEFAISNSSQKNIARSNEGVTGALFIIKL